MTTVVEGSALELAKAVRARRKEMGWSQEALAARVSALGVAWHQTTVAKIESTNRPRTLSVQESVALALALGLARLEDLFGPSSQVEKAVRRNWANRARDDMERDRKIMTGALERIASEAGTEIPSGALAQFNADLANIHAEFETEIQRVEHDAVRLDEISAPADQASERQSGHE